MRTLKYVAHLCIQLVILYAFTEAEDKYFLDTCARRLECFNSCNKAYFPSLACKDLSDLTPPLSYEIELNGNTFDSFYKYPNPAWVKTHMKASGAAQPAASSSSGAKVDSANNCYCREVPASEFTDGSQAFSAQCQVSGTSTT